MEVKKVYRLISIVMIMATLEVGCDDQLPDAPKSEALMYYEQIPIEKRDLFIRYYLGEALKQMGSHIERAPRYSVDIVEEFGAPPQGFAINLLNGAKAKLGLEDKHIKTLVEEAYVCIPGKGCYDPDDVGGSCCPW